LLKYEVKLILLSFFLFTKYGNKSIATYCATAAKPSNNLTHNGKPSSNAPHAATVIPKKRPMNITNLFAISRLLLV
ncbi:MAG: hypothetical protein ACI4SO_00775, partial [Muribaculaceae bacterium]